jgi:outer membrane receptor protein involved in Fe transport
MLIWALAQAAVAAAPAAPVEQQGVVSYRPEFFAALNPNNANDMLGRIPGFSLDTGAGVRGFEGAAGNVLIDGQRPSSKSDSLDQILTRIPASKVERIDVIRGGAPGIDMQGKTVIANVITKKGGATRGLLSISNYRLTDGRYFTNNLRAEASGGHGDSTWELGARGGSGPDDAVSTGRGVVTHADGTPSQVALLDSKGLDMFYSLTGSGETPVLGGRLRLNGRWLAEKFKEPETDRIIAPTPDTQSFGFTQKTTDTELGGRFSRAFGATTDLELIGLRTTRDRDTDSSSLITGSNSDFFNHQESSEAILRGVLKRRFGGTVSAEAGGEYALNKLDSRTRFTIDAALVPLPAANVQVQEKRAETFVKATWRATADLTVDGAFRYESSEISSAGDVVLSKRLRFAKPRVAVTWQAASATQLRFRVEREVGQLNFGDFVASSSLANGVGVTAGNPDLNPQQSWTSEAAIEQQVWKGASLLLTGRHYNYTDVIDRGPVFSPDGTVFDRPTNIGSGTEDDLSLDVTLPFDALGWKGGMIKGGFVKRWTAVRDPTTGETREISGAHPSDWSVTFSQDLPSRKLNAGVDVYGQFRRSYYRFNLIETVKLQTYVRPYLEWKPTAAWSLRAELPIVTAPDVRYRDTLQIFPGPRGAGGRPDIEDRHFHFPAGFYFRILRNIG